MQDGDTQAKNSQDNGICVSCKRVILVNELYGAHGLCSQCLEVDVRGDGIGGE